MRRHAIGAISLIGLFIAAFCYITKGYVDGLEKNVFAAMSLRLGVVMGAIWLGLPDLNRLFAKYPPWVFLIAIVIVLMVVANPRFFPFVITLVVIAISIQFVSRIVQPGPPSKTQRKSQGSSKSAKEETKK